MSRTRDLASLVTRRLDGSDLTVLLGLSLLAVGLGLIYLPAALAVVGLLLVGIGIQIGRVS